MPYAKLEEIELYYEEAGEGYPIVLGHGGFSDITEWDPQVEALSKRFRVIRYDRRGCGRSHPRDVPQLAELWVEDLRRFMLNLGLERAYLGGVSYGGMLLIEFLLKRQEMCRAALIVSATARGREKTSEKIDVLPQQAGQVCRRSRRLRWWCRPPTTPPFRRYTARRWPPGYPTRSW